MSIKVPKPNHNSVPEYQLSGYPYCVTIINTENNANTTTKGTLSFPRITRWIQITANVKDAHVFFVDDVNAGGGNANTIHNNQAFIVPAGTTSPRLELRCIKLYHNQNGDPGGTDPTIEIVSGLTHLGTTEFIKESEFDWNK
tara:strand:- start:54 stop:479 length:426 start_codon:yes stop_codon:yes gene_type:complete